MLTAIFRSMHNVVRDSINVLYCIMCFKTIYGVHYVRTVHYVYLKTFYFLNKNDCLLHPVIWQILVMKSKSV